jgi:predicted RNA binding protein YcfA (HicA-like mRNA interferase family)
VTKPQGAMPSTARTPPVTGHRASRPAVATFGSVRAAKHPERVGARVVVPIHAGRILKPKTLAAILKSAEIAGDELQGLL